MRLYHWRDNENSKRNLIRKTNLIYTKLKITSNDQRPRELTSNQDSPGSGSHVRGAGWHRGWERPNFSTRDWRTGDPNWSGTCENTGQTMLKVYLMSTYNFGFKQVDWALDRIHSSSQNMSKKAPSPRCNLTNISKLLGKHCVSGVLYKANVTA